MTEQSQRPNPPAPPPPAGRAGASVSRPTAPVEETPWIPPEGRDPKTGRILPGFGGRKPGSRNKQSREAVASVQALAGDAIDGLRVLIAQQSFPAIRYVLDMTLPRDGRPIELDATSSPYDLIEAATSGEISPSEFARLTQGMKAALDASELKELRASVDELETLIATLKK
ncbi:MAG: hypothetical protein K5799_11385 [Erythrobacter sp.]|nr:hypothetical protein [Erythrobacter sp.]